MSSGARGCKASLLDWLAEAVAEGWVPEDEIRRLEKLEESDAGSLFESGGRPLTIGFFGGTGVGKSSLLNRLVGDAVAAVGLQRPTSTEVTLYVHEQYPVKHLEDLFPLGRVRVLEHRRDEYRDVVWIDMPDIDSIERSNRELVYQWLPYLDWLVYVVSPERYRDDAGWRVLQQRGYRHHWLFVMNRRDTGTEDQYRDFRRLLGSEGFDETLVLQTSCTVPEGDDFQRMVEEIEHAVGEHGLERLQQVGEQARLLDLDRECARYAETLGGSAEWRRFIDRGRNAIDEKLAALNAYLRQQAAIEAAGVPDRASAGAAPAVPEPVLPGLTADYVQDLQAAVVVAAEGLPGVPVQTRTRTLVQSLERSLLGVLRDGFREGVARPGNALHRGVETLMRKLVYGLPLAVCVVVGYFVVTRYEQGLNGDSGFLGLDFLVHSLMVLGLSALAPYLLARLVRPSVRRSIVKRVAAGLEGVRSTVVREWIEAMEELTERRRDLSRSLDEVRQAIEAERGALEAARD